MAKKKLIEMTHLLTFFQVMHHLLIALHQHKVSLLDDTIETAFQWIFDGARISVERSNSKWVSLSTMQSVRSIDLSIAITDVINSFGLDTGQSCSALLCHLRKLGGHKGIECFYFNQPLYYSSLQTKFKLDHKHVCSMVEEGSISSRHLSNVIPCELLSQEWIQEDVLANLYPVELGIQQQMNSVNNESAADSDAYTIGKHFVSPFDNVSTCLLNPLKWEEMQFTACAFLDNESVDCPLPSISQSHKKKKDMEICSALHHQIRILKCLGNVIRQNINDWNKKKQMSSKADVIHMFYSNISFMLILLLSEKQWNLTKGYSRVCWTHQYKTQQNVNDIKLKTRHLQTWFKHIVMLGQLVIQLLTSSNDLLSQYANHTNDCYWLDNRYPLPGIHRDMLFVLELLHIWLNEVQECMRLVGHSPPNQHIQVDPQNNASKDQIPKEEPMEEDMAQKANAIDAHEHDLKYVHDTLRAAMQTCCQIVTQIYQTNCQTVVQSHLESAKRQPTKVLCNLAHISYVHTFFLFFIFYFYFSIANNNFDEEDEVIERKTKKFGVSEINTLLNIGDIVWFGIKHGYAWLDNYQPSVKIALEIAKNMMFYQPFLIRLRMCLFDLFFNGDGDGELPKILTEFQMFYLAGDRVMERILKQQSKMIVSRKDNPYFQCECIRFLILLKRSLACGKRLTVYQKSNVVVDQLFESLLKTVCSQTDDTIDTFVFSITFIQSNFLNLY
ncbi:hypothetical protein RFI_13948 [Reticulomyxa filosa]|uniref:Uncharacterized protein n=1 Tax=Reticulomyxa filosa TaxID=46433 RepID=X6NBG3_RETFI|nr:hypothetical protein RFI_13948 [Reticulomyxa filosa]|eukprot:ETO23238.1 hypothetical protein RFI_13948 [Reticulomyxa filosa]